jgi:hypothetical protein
MPIGRCGPRYRRPPPLSGEARKRLNARRCARAAKRRGKIKPQPCAVCGSRRSEMHHPDYELPRTVVWLCQAHHLAWHAHFRALALRAFNRWLKARPPALPSPLPAGERSAARNRRAYRRETR